MLAKGNLQNILSLLELVSECFKLFFGVDNIVIFMSLIKPTRDMCHIAER